MAFNWGRAAAAGAAGALNSYGGMLKADREANAEQVRLDAQQAREENMLRFKQTVKREDEQYDYDKGVERRDSDEQWKRDQIAPTAEAAAKAKRDVEGTPEAVAARKAKASEESAAAVAQAKAVTEAKADLTEAQRVKEVARLQGVLKEHGDNLTPAEHSQITMAMEGLNIPKDAGPKDTEANRIARAKHNKAVATEAAELFPKGESPQQDAQHDAFITQHSISAPVGKKKGQTVGQLKKTKANKEKAEAGTETPEDRQALAQRVANGDKRAEAIVGLLSPEKQRDVIRLVEEAKVAQSPTLRPTTRPGAPVSTLGQQAPGVPSRMQAPRGQASQGQLMEEPDPLRRGQAFQGVLSR